MLQRLKVHLTLKIQYYDTEIEERDPNEVLYFGECRVAPKGTEVENPSFDIVPSDLITGIITEEGILGPF